MIDLFACFSLDSLVTLYTSALLENQIILLSKDSDKLHLASTCLMAILFPFAWMHVYVPMLPLSLLHSLEAPFPFIMGIQSVSSVNIGATITKTKSKCIVDIDCGRVLSDEEIPKLPNRVELITKLMMTLESYAEHNGMYKNVADIYRKTRHSNSPTKTNLLASQTNGHKEFGHCSHSHVQGSDKEDSQLNKYILTPLDIKFNHEIVSVFLTHMAAIFDSYVRYIIWPTVSLYEFENIASNERQILFNGTGFLCNQKFEDLPFLSLFIETQMFATFINNKVKNLWRKTTRNNYIFDSILNNTCQLDLSEEQIDCNQVHSIFCADNFDPQAFENARIDKKLSSLDLKFFDENTFTISAVESSTAHMMSADNEGDDLDLNIDALADFGQIQTIESRDSSIIQGLLIDIKVRVNQILVFKLDPENFLSYIADTAIKSEIELCKALFSIFLKIVSHGAVRNSTPGQLWQLITLCQSSLLSNLQYDPSDELKPRYSSRGKIRQIPSSFEYVYQCVTDMDLENDEKRQMAWFFLALERNLLADLVETLINDSVSMTFYSRWSFLRRKNDAVHLVHHLKNLSQVEFSCFTDHFKGCKIYYRLITVLADDTNKNQLKKTNCHITLYSSKNPNSDQKNPNTKSMPSAKLSVSKLSTELLCKIPNIGGQFCLMRITLGNMPDKLLLEIDYFLLRNEYTNKTLFVPCNRVFGMDSPDKQQTHLCRIIPLNTVRNKGRNDSETFCNLFSIANDIYDNYLAHKLLMDGNENLAPWLENYLPTIAQRMLSRISGFPFLSALSKSQYDFNDAKSILLSSVEVIQKLNTKTPRLDIIESIFGQRGILDVLRFIFKLNFGQFSVVSFLNGINHPWQMILELSSNFMQKTTSVNRYNISLRKSIKVMSDLATKIDQFDRKIGMDEKLTIFIWVGI
ncbi:MAG: DENN domain-containing protein 5B, partial [Paramarteilia canceri]